MTVPLGVTGPCTIGVSVWISVTLPVLERAKIFCAALTV